LQEQKKASSRQGKIQAVMANGRKRQGFFFCFGLVRLTESQRRAVSLAYDLIHTGTHWSRRNSSGRETIQITVKGVVWLACELTMQLRTELERL
jgi:hypothetical protein